MDKHKRAGYLARLIRSNKATAEQIEEFARIDNPPVPVQAATIWDLPVAEALFAADAAEMGR